MKTKLACDRCGNYQKNFFILKHKNGKNYCFDCKLIMSDISPDDLQPVSQEKFNKMLEIVSNTPPLKLKELKEKLKKEREKRKLVLSLQSKKKFKKKQN